MSAHEVGSRELRNETAGVLARVSAGERVVITTRGKQVAELVPMRPERARWLTRSQLVERLSRAQADSGLRADLARLAGDTTDDLGPVA